MSSSVRMFAPCSIASPIVVLLGLLGGLEWSAPRAAAAGLATALAVAVLVYKMPLQAAVAAAGYGAGFVYVSRDLLKRPPRTLDLAAFPLA